MNRQWQDKVAHLKKGEDVDDGYSDEEQTYSGGVASYGADACSTTVAQSTFDALSYGSGT